MNNKGNINKRDNDLLNKLISGQPIDDIDLAPMPAPMEQPVPMVQAPVQPSQALPQSSEQLVAPEPQTDLSTLLKMYQQEKYSANADISKQEKLDEDNRKKAIILNMIKGMAQGAAKVGQGIAGRYSGKFDTDNSSMDNTFKGFTDALSQSNKPKTGDRLKDLLDVYKLEQGDRRLQSIYDLEGGRQGRFNRGQGFREAEKQELSDKQTEELAGYDEGLSLLSDAMSMKDNVDTGLISSGIQSGRELFGGGNPDFVKLKMRVGESLAKKVKALSGTAASDTERAFLQSISLPEPKDDDDIFKTKLNEAIRIMEQAKSERIRSFEKQGKDPSRFKEQKPKSLVKKQYSKSANKTKLIYDDGSEEIVDGQQ